MSVFYGFRNVDLILRKAVISAKSGLNIVNSILIYFQQDATLQSSNPTGGMDICLL